MLTATYKKLTNGFENIQPMKSSLFVANKGPEELSTDPVADSLLATIRPSFLFGNADSSSDDEDNYILPFNAQYIKDTILAKENTYHRDAVFKHISIMIMLGIEKGDDLEFIQFMYTSKPSYAHYFSKLMEVYHLEEKDWRSRTTITLTRVLLTFPDRTCLYLHQHAETTHTYRGILECMQAISKNYPKEMITFAFTFLIPNKENEFCLLIKKAHMLFQHVFFSKKVTQSCISNIAKRIISDIIKYTDTVINESHINYEAQIYLLKKFDLITEVENTDDFNVTEKVIEAAKKWDELIEKNN